MLVAKTITLLRLAEYQSDEDGLSKLLDRIASERLSVRICYDQSSAYSMDSMIGMLDGETIGRVSAESKRYIVQLLNDHPSGVVAKFHSVVNREGHTPVLKFKVNIDPARVEKIVAGEEWGNWTYTGTRLHAWGSVPQATYLIDELASKTIMSDSLPAFDVVEPYINKLMQVLKTDMSIDTSNAMDDLLFWLETMRQAEADMIQEQLEHAYIKRRTENCRLWFAMEYFPSFLKSNDSMELWRRFLCKISYKGNVDFDLLKEKQIQLEHELQDLPYNLYDYIDDIKALWAIIFYKKIPASKQLDLMSALTIRYHLRCLDAQNNPSETHIHGDQVNGGTYIKNVERFENK